MEQLELQNLWKSNDQKLDAVLRINRQLLVTITQDKAIKAINKTKPLKYFGILIGIIWVIFLYGLVFVGWHSGNWVFMISMAVISILTKIAIGTYVYQLILIHQIDHSQSVLAVQSRLAAIKTSTLRATRIVALQLPFWTTWYLNTDLFAQGSIIYILINSGVVLLFTYFAYWFYKNLRAENLGQKWMKWLFADGEWNQLNYAGHLLDELQAYEEEVPTDS